MQRCFCAWMVMVTCMAVLNIVFGTKSEEWRREASQDNVRNECCSLCVFGSGVLAVFGAVGADQRMVKKRWITIYRYLSGRWWRKLMPLLGWVFPRWILESDLLPSFAGRTRWDPEKHSVRMWRSRYRKRDNTNTLGSSPYAGEQTPIRMRIEREEERNDLQNW